MKIAIGSDHRGYHIKQRIALLLQQLGHDVIDLGTDGTSAVDYPDQAIAVSHRVSKGHADRGILICGTGIGMSIAANKVRGIRAVPALDGLIAEMARRHNDANVLCLSADMLGEELIDQMVRIFLLTEFEGGRHARRVEKIAQYETDKQGKN